MDATLRLLKRLAQEDPEAKDRYIAALERVVGGQEPYETILDVCTDIRSISDDIEKTIEDSGILVEGIPHTPQGVMLLIEYEDSYLVSGLALANNTRSVVSAMVHHFGLSSIKNWSADPLIILENQNIFVWGFDKIYLV